MGKRKWGARRLTIWVRYEVPNQGHFRGIFCVTGHDSAAFTAAADCRGGAPGTGSVPAASRASFRHSCGHATPTKLRYHLQLR
jgi:hypothetical protein